jgi:hypothetical protein
MGVMSLYRYRTQEVTGSSPASSISEPVETAGFPPRPTLRASSELASGLDVLPANDDFVWAEARHPVERAGAEVRLAGQAFDTCAAEQPAEDLGFLLRRHDVEHYQPVTGHR